MEFYTNARKFGNKILYRGYSKSGERVQEQVDYHPTLWIPSNDKSDEYRDLNGRPLKEIKPGTIKDTSEFIDQYSDVENFDIFGNTRHQFAFLRERFPGQVFYDEEKIITANVDIEVDSTNGFPSPIHATEKVTAISVKFGDRIYAMGYGDFKTDREDVGYMQFDDEWSLLRGFINKWTAHDPDIVTGWNIKGFDIPYLINRIYRIMGEDYAKKLSPWGHVMKRDHFDQYGNEAVSFDIVGVSIIDYMEAYKKFTLKMQSSYKLDYIASVEGVGQKIEYDEYDGLHDLCEKDHQKFIEYNIHDVELVDWIDSKKQILRLIKWLAYNAKINLEDPFFQVRIWDTLIYNELLDKKVVVPLNKGDGAKSEKYEGAYVKEPEVGFYNYLASFDLDSLYPHLIMQFSVGPDSFVPRENLEYRLSSLKKEARNRNIRS